MESRTTTGVALLPLIALLALPAGAEAPENRLPRVLSPDELAQWKEARPSLAIRASIDGRALGAKKPARAVRGQKLTLSVAAPREALVKWFLVLPDLSRNYANAADPWSKDAYAWRGLDTIGYFQVELVELEGRSEIAPFESGAVARAVDALKSFLADRGTGARETSFYHADEGTFFFAAEAVSGDKRLRTRGAADVNDRGISDGVLRVALCADDTLIGAVTGFYNVAGLFGSTTYQSARHIGADCADLLTAALAEWRRKPLAANANVQQLTQKLRAIADGTIEEGNPNAPLRWGVDIRAGDFIAVKYEGFRKFVHIGALYRDADGDGLLGASDLVIHAGPEPLHLSRMGSGVFDGEVRILRP